MEPGWRAVRSGSLYALDEALPDHSSLTRIRQRLGLVTCARFFERVADLCEEADLVWGRELYVDTTKGHQPRVAVGHVFAARAALPGLRPVQPVAP